MNKENILAVADAIEKQTIPDLGFNMGEVVTPADIATPDRSGHGCGTVACIAGWAISIQLGAETGAEAFEKYMADFTDRGSMAGAEKWMGLSERQGDALFFGRGAKGLLSEIPQDQAVRTLRHLAETGEVNWSVA